jgi:hypothetical protein
MIIDEYLQITYYIHYDDFKDSLKSYNLSEARIKELWNNENLRQRIKDKLNFEIDADDLSIKLENIANNFLEPEDLYHD